MKPTTAERKGLHYEKIVEINPKIIYGSISAFGEIGPMKTLQAMIRFCKHIQAL